MSFNKADLKLLCEIGFSAIQTNVQGNPKVIFDTLCRERPENACGCIGLSLIAATKLDYKTALSLLDEENYQWTQARDHAAEVRDLYIQFIVNQVGAVSEATAQSA